MLISMLTGTPTSTRTSTGPNTKTGIGRPTGRATGGATGRPTGRGRATARASGNTTRAIARGRPTAIKKRPIGLAARRARTPCNRVRTTVAVPMRAGRTWRKVVPRGHAPTTGWDRGIVLVPTIGLNSETTAPEPPTVARAAPRIGPTPAAATMLLIVRVRAAALLETIASAGNQADPVPPRGGVVEVLAAAARVGVVAAAAVAAGADVSEVV